MGEGIPMKDEKDVSKTGATGLATAVAGLVLLLFPSMVKDVPPEILAQAVGAALGLIGSLVMIFRKISDGKKPKIV